MKKKFTINGFDVVKDIENNTHYIDDFPQFPNKNKNSKEIFQIIEQIVLTEKVITFPMKFNMIERVVKLCIDTEEYFSFEGIKNLIDRDKHLFLGTNTFFKVKFSYEENFPILKIIYYTIDNDKGQIDCSSMDMLLHIIFINYNQQQFTKKRVDYLENVVGLNMDEIRQIPLLPVQWLNFDENGNLLDFPNFELHNED
ncbi:hypothetical protein [Flavobacterium sp.]|uniref:hypothetical protein n=1 Tax=Flavobacterium sp. TaxID=239 RepID=UPI00260CB781|nr:hypothetical protein [Flavobacterium sp.]